MNVIPYECDPIWMWSHMNEEMTLQMQWSVIGCQLDAIGEERLGAGVETQNNIREEIGGWGRVPFNEPYAPSLSTIYDGE